VFAYVILRTSTDTKRFETTVQTTGMVHPSLDSGRSRRGTTLNGDNGMGVHIHLERVVHGEAGNAGSRLELDSDDMSKHTQKESVGQIV
jgi:hypothetical protein